MNPVFSQKLTTNVNVSGSRKPFSVESKQPVRSRPTKIHELCVYEINERDRGSPAYLRLDLFTGDDKNKDMRALLNLGFNQKLCHR
ncbi:hypothetical protein L1987_23242 [Smallanthus sonchifolius]|uniref:Uncharacterized protein n=1 Tax=Smallanthus sonchifolius TaxID=185202 RepID=A0ACB9IIL1_9ASTR|nr:hypothetical protein L1987_23242 [Smallanthus sonchifolius]